MLNVSKKRVHILQRTTEFKNHFLKNISWVCGTCVVQICVCIRDRIHRFLKDSHDVCVQSRVGGPCVVTTDGLDRLNAFVFAADVANIIDIPRMVLTEL